MFTVHEKKYVVGGAVATGVGVGGLAVIPANAVLSTPVTMTFASPGVAPQVVHVVQATGWGMCATLSKGLIVVGTGCFLYGFGRGIIRSIREHRAMKNMPVQKG